VHDIVLTSDVIVIVESDAIVTVSTATLVGGKTVVESDPFVAMDEHILSIPLYARRCYLGYQRSLIQYTAVTYNPPTQPSIPK